MMHGTRLGVDSHGIRLLPHYIQALEGGRLNKTPQLRTVSGFGAVETLDADHAQGALAAYTGMTRAIALANAFGIGAVAIPGPAQLTVKDIVFRASYGKLAGIICEDTITQRVEESRQHYDGWKFFIQTNSSGLNNPGQNDPGQHLPADAPLCCAKAPLPPLPEGWLDFDALLAQDEPASMPKPARPELAAGDDPAIEGRFFVAGNGAGHDNGGTPCRNRCGVGENAIGGEKRAEGRGVGAVVDEDGAVRHRIVRRRGQDVEREGARGEGVGAGGERIGDFVAARRGTFQARDAEGERAVAPFARSLPRRTGLAVPLACSTHGRDGHAPSDGHSFAASAVPLRPPLKTEAIPASAT